MISPGKEVKSCYFDKILDSSSMIDIKDKISSC